MRSTPQVIEKRESAVPLGATPADIDTAYREARAALQGISKDHADQLLKRLTTTGVNGFRARFVNGLPRWERV